MKLVFNRYLLFLIFYVSYKCYSRCSWFLLIGNEFYFDMQYRNVNRVFRDVTTSVAETTTSSIFIFCSNPDDHNVFLIVVSFVLSLIFFVVFLISNLSFLP
jgi:hypothetical protein